MSDWYEVLMDHEASREDAATIGRALMNVLIEEQLILPEPNTDCVLSGEGHPPGARIHELYEFGEREGRWDTLQTNGVRLYAEPYFNFFGTTSFGHSSCPICACRFSGKEFGVINGSLSRISAFAMWQLNSGTGLR